MDKYLSMAVRLEYWGPNIRPFHLMTDKTNVDGKQKVLVTVTSEAFGLLMFANCRDKWLNVFQYKKTAKRKGTKVPQYKKDDPTTHKYKGKWSSSRTGSAVGGGWSSEALVYFEAAKKNISEWRKEEEARGNTTYLLAQRLIKVANKIHDSDDEEPAKKKQKSNSYEDGDQQVKMVDLTFMDE